MILRSLLRTILFQLSLDSLFDGIVKNFHVMGSGQKYEGEIKEGMYFSRAVQRSITGHVDTERFHIYIISVLAFQGTIIAGAVRYTFRDSKNTDQNGVAFLRHIEFYL